MTYVDIDGEHRIVRLTARPVLELHRAVPGGPMPVVEGPAFDLAGSLLFTSVHGDAEGNRIFSVDLDRGEVNPVYGDDHSSFTAIAVHRNGDLFLADLGLPSRAGRIARMSADGSAISTVVHQFEGQPVYPDDLVFDRRGVLYFNDMQGNVFRPTGKILTYSPDGRVELIADGLAAPNGTTFSPDGSRLWVSEHTANRLLAMDLDTDGRLDDGSLPGSAITVLSHFSGGEVDSLTVDSAGNVYAAMYRGGRVDVLDAEGTPVATITPEGGRLAYPNTTHVVIKPGTRDGYLVAASRERAMLFTFEALAPADALFSHQSTDCTHIAP
ncbi:SMP-30/gluconolactonase/LRE family protein [Rhodococcus koreensis]